MVIRFLLTSTCPESIKTWEHSSRLIETFLIGRKMYPVEMRVIRKGTWNDFYIGGFPVNEKHYCENKLDYLKLWKWINYIIANGEMPDVKW